MNIRIERHHETSGNVVGQHLKQRWAFRLPLHRFPLRASLNNPALQALNLRSDSPLSEQALLYTPEDRSISTSFLLAHEAPKAHLEAQDYQEIILAEDNNV